MTTRNTARWLLSQWRQNQHSEMGGAYVVILVGKSAAQTGDQVRRDAK